LVINNGYHIIFLTTNINICEENFNQIVIAVLWHPEGLPSGAPYSYRKEKETHELVFSWLSWLVALLVGAYA